MKLFTFRKGLMLALAALMLLIPSAQAESTFDPTLLDREAAYLDLGDAVVEDWEAFCAFLDECPNLTKVDMFATVIGRKRIEALDQQYPQIEFGWTMEVGDHIVRTDATCFSTLHYSADTPHSNGEMALLRFCKQLRALDIGHNAVDDISFLTELPELRVLIVACNRIKDITPIASLQHLEYLEMFSNFVTDLSPIVDLPYLVHLNIGYNNISDLTPLHHMPQLKRLWMKKCHSRMKAPDLSDAVIAELQVALGDCVINTEDNPSEGGWRECVEFDTFHEYFRNGQYKPFPTSPIENQ